MKNLKAVGSVKSNKLDRLKQWNCGSWAKRREKAGSLHVEVYQVSNAPGGFIHPAWRSVKSLDPVAFAPCEYDAIPPVFGTFQVSLGLRSLDRQRRQNGISGYKSFCCTYACLHFFSKEIGFVDSSSSQPKITERCIHLPLCLSIIHATMRISKTSSNISLLTWMIRSQNRKYVNRYQENV